jgi:hypothetical protein
VHASCRVAVRTVTLRSGLAAKRTDSDTVKTTVELPGELWRAAKIRAMDERADLRTVLIRALEDYLRGTQPERPARSSPSP